MFDVWEATAADIHRAVAERETTFAEVVEGYLDRIAACRPASGRW